MSDPASTPISLCLSAATILRCPSLSQFQYIVILIPTVLEVIFTTSLAIINWNSGRRRHLFLTSEGAFYFILNVLDLLSHVLTSARADVDVFAGFDVAIGVTSFLPLFLYTFFLYIYSNTELLSNTPSLPRILGKVGSLVLLFAIPAIIGANEVAAFIGIRRISENDNILIGFDSRSAYTVNTFFSSLTLALLILFQAVVFLVAFFRLIIALINQRRFQSSGRDAAHLVNGIAWLATGMKLGAIETTIGFAGGGFGIVLTRRIIRFIGRACLCIAIVKGVDEIEDFRAVRKELTYENEKARGGKFFKDEKRSIRHLIGNPRTSTFRPLSPTATNFYNLPRAHLLPNPTFDYNKELALGEEARGISVANATSTDPRGPARLRSLQELQGIATFANLRDEANRQRPRERVTIGYRGSNGPPTLQLRLSSGRFPSPTRIIESVKSTISGISGGASGFRRLSSGSLGSGEGTIPYFADGEQGERGRKLQRGELNEKQRYQYPQDSTDYRQSYATTVATTMTSEPDPVMFLRPNVSVLFPTNKNLNDKNNNNAMANFNFNADRKNDNILVPPAKFRDSVTPSMMAESSIEIVAAPQRTVSQARATLYRAPSATTTTTIGKRPYNNANTITEGEVVSGDVEEDITAAKPIYAEELTDSPDPQSFAVPPAFVQRALRNNSTATVQQQQQFRIVSDYSDFNAVNSNAAAVNPFDPNPTPSTSDFSSGNSNRNTQTSLAPSEAETLRLETVHELTKQFPGPPLLTYNGRPLMGGLGGSNIYDSSVPTTPADAEGRQTFTPNAAAIPSVPNVGAVTAATRAQMYARAQVYGDQGQRLGGSPGRQVLDTLRFKSTGSTANNSKLNYAADPELGEGRSRFDDSDSSDYEYAGLPIVRPKLAVTTAVGVPMGMATMAGGAAGNATRLVPPNAPFAAPSHRVSAPVSLSPDDASAYSASSPSNGFSDISPSNFYPSSASPSDDNSPSNVYSAITPSSAYPPGLVQLVSSGGGDPFNELAVRTGASRDMVMKDGGDGMPRGAGGLLTPPVDGDAGVGRRTRPPSKIVWFPQQEADSGANPTTTMDEERQQSMDEERRRQYSIDAAAHALSNSIPWLKNPEVEEEERELAIALNAAKLRLPRGAAPASSDGSPSSYSAYDNTSSNDNDNNTILSPNVMASSPLTMSSYTPGNTATGNGNNFNSISRIKSVGNVMTAKKKSTPVPTRPTRIPRKSLYIEPIMLAGGTVDATGGNYTYPSNGGTTIVVVPTVRGAGQRMSFSGRVDIVRDSVLLMSDLAEGTESPGSVASPPGSGIRRDSEVLGLDDGGVRGGVGGVATPKTPRFAGVV